MTGEKKISMEGGCPCGAARYRLTAAPMFVHCCHCTWCQRESGSAFAVNAIIEASEVEILKGSPERIRIPSNSGGGQTFTRCPECKIAVWSNYSGVGNKIHFIRAGTLDDPSQTPPDIHIFTSTKQPWVTLTDNVPVVEEYYRRSNYWPEESIARYKAAREA